MTTATILGPGELAGLLADLVRTAGTDRLIPGLASVRLHATGGMLHGWSTDRFRAGHAAAPAEGDLPPMLIARSDAEQAAKTFRTDRNVTITVSDDKVTMAGMTTTLIFATADEASQFPKVINAISHDLPTEHGPVLFSPAYLADFAAIAKRRKGLVELVPNVGRKPASVRVGEHYRAWLMPIGLPHDTPITELDWLTESW
jgi:hypothetical protein